MRRPARLSLSVKFGLVLFVVVAGALAIVYFAVVPQLETRLVNAKIRDLETVSPAARGPVESPAFPWATQRTVRGIAETLDLRAVVYDPLTSDSLLPRADSNSERSSADVLRDPVALEAQRTGQLASGRVTRGGRDFAEVAVPLTGGRILLLSASLDDVLANVRLVRRSVVAAGIAAFAVCWLVGYLLAWSFTRRINRLEAAAERVAAGDFATPVVDERRDEVGQLAVAFDSMRLRLAALDRARSEFIANASHELRTPLFSLGGFVELLAEGQVDEAVRRDFLAEMRAQIDRLTRLATDLLDLSRLDAGQLEVERRPLDLHSVARVVCDEFRPVAEAGGRSLRVVGYGPVGAAADEQRVQQIARILVENALRHTPTGTDVEILVEEGDGRAFLAVRDDGPGVPAEEREHLFQRFYRAGGGKASGSGLGLAIASELATRMDGSIELDSQPGDTVFTLSLPPADEAFSRENAVDAATDGARPAARAG